ncbi:unnamed protein product, partial [Scytosiphon promiscuus]
VRGGEISRRGGRGRVRGRCFGMRVSGGMRTSEALAPEGVRLTPPPTRRGTGATAVAVAAASDGSTAAGALPEGTQRAHLAAVTMQWWEARERPRRSAAATVVQTAWRGRAARKAVKAERAARAELLERERERVVNDAAALVQAMVRGRWQRQVFLESRRAAKVVQMWFRGRLRRKWYLAVVRQ